MRKICRSTDRMSDMCFLICYTDSPDAAVERFPDNDMSRGNVFVTLISVSDPDFEAIDCAFDEEAVYITLDYTTISSNGRQLWVFDKRTLYVQDDAPSTAIFNLTRPDDPQAPIFYIPALIRDANGAGEGIGTYTCGYIGPTVSDRSSYVRCFRIDDPTGTPTISDAMDIDLGEIDTVGDLPDAPQNASDSLLDTGDKRITDLVWTDNCLWGTFTIRNEKDQAKAYWF